MSQVSTRHASPVDRQRADILATAAAAAESLGAGAVPDLTGYLTQYYANVAIEDLAVHDPLDLLGSALSHRQLAQQRDPGEALVRVLTPTVDENGWSNGHTIVEVVTDDMPFLVDSLSAALSVAGRGIHLVVHPQFDVVRGPGGELRSVAAVDREGLADLTAVTESWIHFDIDRETNAEELDALTARLSAVLADVRAAVTDWPPMQALAEDVAARLVGAEIPKLAPAEQEEAAQFLLWLADGNFTFLGYRQYQLTGTGAATALAVVPGTGRGLLRGGDDHSRLVSSLPEAVRAKLMDPQPVLLTKANSRSTVHRAVYLDYVGVKRFDDDGVVVGEDRFLGLYTANAYNQTVGDIPVLRAKLEQALAASGFARDSHSGKDLIQFVETYPRDELFQVTAEELLDTALGVLRLQERRRTRLFLRRDPYERFVSALVYLPRDRYTTTVRRRMEAILTEALDSEEVEYTTRVTESVLARLHFVVRARPGGTLPQPDLALLERELAAAARSWEDVFTTELVAAVGEEDGARLAARFGTAMPEAYKEAFPARTGVADIRHLARLAPGATELNLYRPYDATDRVRRLKIYRAGEAVSLSRILPVLQNLGVDVNDERPFTITDSAGRAFRIYDLGLVFPDPDVVAEESLKERFESAFLAMWQGYAEVDGSNALVLRAGLTWREAVLLRALTKYLRQAKMPFSEDYIEWVLVSHPGIARDLITLFTVRFDPGHPGATRDADVAAQRDHVLAQIDEISSLDVDRILRMFVTVIMSCVRTSFFQEQAGDEPLQVSFKLRPRLIPDLPEPRPMFEIWVYSPVVEGVHLRFASIARGGLRWSDRPEDFRTEILGLVKAQEVKNTVIVPSGAKGGFYAKRLPDPGDREAFTTAGKAAYARFIAGLLTLTDNRVADAIVPPVRVVRHDGDDPYLVVAADKGTATFSDLANEVSARFGFWLGDAFASGGSEGYDHKAMGITARGAWESVKRHFRELGVDTQTQDFTCVGIGDMSGDVFGNGMLLSEHIRLVAAFDHRHIFLDPDPDAATGFAERTRMFALPRSSWDSYDRSLISDGGGVFPRTAKSVPLNAVARAALGLPDDVTALPPNELMRAILSAPVDLLWNGGIGTYVKAAAESHAQVGDKSNDGVRVDGQDLRCRVVGEGGNLGMTQRGRIEAAVAGVRLNTDAIDNSAGVDTSDHEVNIKILLDTLVRQGDLTGKQRGRLLVEMTDEVADQVLANNYAQNLVLGNARTQAPGMINVHARMISQLVAGGQMDRDLEFLPGDEELHERELAGRGLTSPELSVLLAYAKLALAEELPAAELAADPYFAPVLGRYFPSQLMRRFPEQVGEHPLGAEIITTSVVNDVVNRGGITFAHRLREETGASALDVVRGYTFARDVFDLPAMWNRLADLDNQVPTAAQGAVYLEARRLVDRTARWLIQTRSAAVDITAEVARYQPVVARLTPELPTLLRGPESRAWRELADRFRGLGVPDQLAEDGASLLYRFQLLDIGNVAQRVEADPASIAALYFCLSERYHVDDFLTRISALPRDRRWSALARQALRSDLYSALASLTAQVARSTPANGDPVERCDVWQAEHATDVARVTATLAEIAALEHHDLAALSVGLRSIRTLVAQSRS